ncbi:MAG: cytidine deaminase, partial [Haemophilus influenzae]|nr:cytidine deaminase [Haemophilus influenzae]
VGVGPRSFLDLFSMAQSAGSKIIRKSNGEKISWDPKEATLRLSSNTFSLNEIEKDIIAKLEEIEQPVN